MTNMGGRGAVFSAGIDAVDELGGNRVADGSIGRGALACVRGWMRYERERPRIDRLTVSIGEDAAVATLGTLRDEPVEEETAALAVDRFWAVVAVTGIEGPHAVTLSLASGGETVRIEPACTVMVTRPADAFAGRPLRPDDWLSAIDGVYFNDHDQAPRAADGAFLLTAGVPAFATLWAIDRQTAAAPQSVIARVGGVYVPVVDGYTRVDAARSVGYRAVQHCGYRVPISPPATGTATLEVFVVSGDGSYARIGAIRYRSVSRLANDALPDSSDMLGSIDEIAVDGRILTDHSIVPVNQGAVVDIRGWCVDRAGPRLAASVDVVIGAAVFEEWEREERSDVVDALRDPSLRDCGFRTRLTIGRLNPGRHQVRVRATTARRDGIGDIADPFVLHVQARAE